MNQQLKDIRGKTVVALKEGKDMGTIHKVYVDPKNKRVWGISVRESRFNTDDKWIDIDKIEHLGEDYLFVAKANDCRLTNPKGRSLKDLIGTQVTNKDGKNLGSLVDVEIDQNWRIVEIDLSDKCTVLIDSDEAVFGEDTILLKAGTEIQQQACRDKRHGFLARLFGAEAVQSTSDTFSHREKTSTREEKKTTSLSNKAPTKTKQARV